jgi:hypothetical protein
MGLSPMSRWSPGDMGINNTGNPDPRNFEIIKIETLNQYSLVMVKFPDCKNCGGIKILLINGMTEEEIRDLDKIDPHFQEGHSTEEPYIIARFEPSNSGWGLGQMMMQVLTGKFDYKNLFQNKKDKDNQE